MELTQLFKEIVSIDSPSGEESRMGEYVMSFARERGFSCVQDSYGNIIIRTDVSIPAKIFFSGHLDTVEPGRGIVCSEKDGFLVSDGTTILGADNKASVAAILHAISTYDRTKLPSIEIIFTTQEETHMNAQHISKESITAPFGYIFDAPFEFGGILLGSPFLEDFSLEVIGRAAHASIPEAGLSVLPVFQKLLARISCGAIGANPASGTVNIGIVSIGTGTNTIPGQLKMRGEIRSFDKDIFVSKKHEIETIFVELQKEFPEYIFTYVFDNDVAGYVHAESDPLVIQAQKALATIGRSPHITTPQSVSDANHFNKLGIPTLVVSEGTQFAHTTAERISIKDLQDISTLVTELITLQTMSV